MITKYNSYNESLKDKLKGKSEEDIKNIMADYNPYSRFTLLQKSIRARYIDGVKKALEPNRWFDKNKPKYIKKSTLDDNERRMVLEYAVETNFVEAVKLLLNKTKLKRWTLIEHLITSSLKGYVVLVRLFIYIGADTDEAIDMLKHQEIEYESEEDINKAVNLIKKNL